MSDWTLLELDDSAPAGLGLREVAWPVPARDVASVMGPPVRLDLLLVHADRWCDEFPGRANSLAPSIARVAHAVGVDALDDHDWASAAHHLRIGLRRDPTNVSLRSHLGLALWGAGDRGRAADQLLATVEISRSVGRTAPLLWVLTARALVEVGRADEAATLLDDVASLLPQEAAFWELRARMA